MSITRYDYGSVIVDLDSDAGDGMLLFAPPEFDLDIPSVGAHGYITAHSMQAADWDRAMADLYAAGFELGNDGDSIGQRCNPGDVRDGWTAYAIQPLGEDDDPWWS